MTGDPRFVTRVRWTFIGRTRVRRYQPYDSLMKQWVGSEHRRKITCDKWCDQRNAEALRAADAYRKAKG